MNIPLAFVAASFAGFSMAQPVSHWAFDESAGSTVAAASAGTADGAVIAPADFVSGVIGNAIDVPGAGYVTMGDILPMTGGVDFSISFWMRTPPGHTAAGVPISKHTPMVVAGYFFHVNRGGPFGETNRVWMYASETPSTVSVSTTDVNDGNWHHVVGVYVAGLNKRIYVDGAPVEAVTPAFPIGAIGAPFVVGGIDSPGGSPINAFTGAVDDLQVYDYVLCDGDVQFLFDNPGSVHVVACLADFNTDGFVNTGDLLAFLNEWVAQNPIADVNCDFIFNTQDVLAYLNLFNAGCP